MKRHIGLSIRNELKRQERSVSWFARYLSCDRSNVYRIFNKESLDTAMLQRICRILNHDFFADISKDISDKG